MRAHQPDAGALQPMDGVSSVLSSGSSSVRVSTLGAGGRGFAACCRTRALPDIAAAPAAAAAAAPGPLPRRSLTSRPAQAPPKVTFEDSGDSTTIRVAQWRAGGVEAVAELTPVFDSLGEAQRWGWAKLYRTAAQHGRLGP